MSKTIFSVKKESLEVTMERIFDAPRELVFKIMSNPELVNQWWGPAIYTTVVEKDEVKVGGKWRYVQSDKAGNAFAFYGEYKEITPPEKMSRTFNYEPIGEGHELVETAVLEDIGNNQTKMTATTKYKTIEDLEGMVNSGMEGGATESWERLALLVEKR